MTKTVFIPGIDGYIGWSLAMHLAARGDKVIGLDRYFRRYWVEEMGSHSVTTIQPMKKRLEAFEREHGHKNITFYEGDLRDYYTVSDIIRKHQPDAIVHLGEQPSAPYSMKSPQNAIFSQVNNISGTLNILFAMHKFAPKTHLVKLGTMGEYGTPNIDIPEGFFEIDYRGRKDRLPFPKQPGSFYHLSKVHDSNNIMFACKIWGLKSTDVMQGVVYGTRTDQITHDDLLTRFDIDEAFGTAINKFCSQTIVGHPLTPYGKGGQKRGFIALRDSVQCLTIAVDNPPENPEYRVFNQFDEVYNVSELAENIQSVGKSLGYDVEIKNIENPRIEAEGHYYKPDSNHLRKLGFKPTQPLKKEVEVMLNDLERFKDRIEAKRDKLVPKILWKKLGDNY